MKCHLYVEVEFDENQTDPDSLACAADNLMETALSIAGPLEEYGPVKFGEFLVLPPDIQV